MRRELQELSEELRALDNVDAFWSRIHAELQSFGVRSVQFAAMASRREVELGRLTRSLIWRSTHPAEYIEALGGGDEFLDNDLSAQHCVVSSDLIFWHDDQVWATATPQQRRQWAIERDLGLGIGVTVPSSYYVRRQLGGVGIATPDIPRDEFPKYWRRHGRQILAICGILDTGMREQHMGSLVGLSPREQECLTWLAVGLRPDQIADRLRISNKSVDKYIQGAKVKLRASTRDHAVAKALIFNLIVP